MKAALLLFAVLAIAATAFAAAPALYGLIGITIILPIYMVFIILHGMLMPLL